MLDETIKKIWNGVKKAGSIAMLCSMLNGPVYADASTDIAPDIWYRANLVADQVIDQKDLLKFIECSKQPFIDEECSQADINEDRAIDSKDLFYFNPLWHVNECDLPQPEINAFFKDELKREFNLSGCYIEPRLFLETGFSDRAATVDSDHVYHVLDLTMLEKIEKWGYKLRFYSRDGSDVIGRWVSNDVLINFYADIGNPFEGAYFYGTTNDEIFRSPLTFINTIVFDELRLRGYCEPEEKYHKTIELDDGRIFTTDCGYAFDYCGHGWSNRYHKRLQDNCRVLDGSRYGRTIPLEEIAEIELTGKFDDEYEHCREIIINYKDGRVEEESLFLTSESYGGVCNHDKRFRDFDKMYLLDKNGAVFISLDDIKKITLP